MANGRGREMLWASVQIQVSDLSVNYFYNLYILIFYDFEHICYIFTYEYIIIYCNAEFSDVSPHKNEKIQNPLKRE